MDEFTLFVLYTLRIVCVIYVGVVCQQGIDEEGCLQVTVFGSENR